jgi:predicted alpha/beta superfamily hydrolase
MTETAVVTPLGMSRKAPMSFRAAGFAYDHEVLIALPPSYYVEPDRSYPVLWAMDGSLFFDLIVGLFTVGLTGFRYPEMIVIGVGHPSSEGLEGLAKRTVDLWPPGSTVADGPAKEHLDAMLAPDRSAESMFDGVKGDEFLAFLVDQLRPALAEQYRMNDDHVLFGHSAGAAFAGYALFARPGSFQRYILGSCTNELTIKLEAAHAATHDDLAAHVFLSAGDREANTASLAAQRMVSRTMLLAENLLLRQYPSLRLRTRVYTGGDHYSIVPGLISDGLQFVFAPEIAQLPSAIY